MTIYRGTVSVEKGQPLTMDIKSDDLKTLEERHEQYTKVRDAVRRVEHFEPPAVYLGTYLKPLSGEQAEVMQLTGDSGVLVNDIMENSPAAKAGIRKGDVIFTIDDFAVGSLGDMLNAMMHLHAGQQVQIVIFRDGREMTFEAALEARASLDTFWNLWSMSLIFSTSSSGLSVQSGFFYPWICLPTEFLP
ncbi:MAG: PDZ domain-containing protein [Planctomycetes bacterium]|nr:PDZ domain-containing protein [Planctomycetota bacterium]